MKLKKAPYGAILIYGADDCLVFEKLNDDLK